MTTVFKLLGLALAGSCLGALGLGRAELSPSGWAWSLLGLALASVPFLSRFPVVRVVIACGAVLFVSLRLFVPRGPSRATVWSLHADGKLTAAPRLDRLFDERDAAIVGSRLLVTIGWVRAPEFPRLPEVIAIGLDRLELDGAPPASPVVTTLLGLESSRRSTTFVFEPRQRRASVGVVFLHGYGGNFGVQCSVIARALPDALVLCPSTGIAGDWWSADGLATIEAAHAALRARGIDRVLLMGISNGAVGVGLALPRVTSRFDGAVMISGVAPSAPTPSVPALVLHGTHDGMMRAALVRRWADSHGVRLRELSGTHFVLLEQEAAVAEALREFVARQA